MIYHGNVGTESWTFVVQLTNCN